MDSSRLGIGGAGAVVATSTGLDSSSAISGAGSCETSDTVVAGRSCSHSEERSISAASAGAGTANSAVSFEAIAAGCGGAPWKNNPDGTLVTLAAAGITGVAVTAGLSEIATSSTASGTGSVPASEISNSGAASDGAATAALTDVS